MSAALCVLGTVALALLFVLFSFDAVEQNEYGLLYNWVTKTLSKDVFHGGTHFVGLWNKFLVFPATVQTIEFSSRPGLANARMLQTRTKEGLGLQLSISFQYMLDPNHIKELFAVTNVFYENLYVRIAREQLLGAASEYEGPQYWLERKAIGEHMRSLLDAKLRENFAWLWGLQLQVIDLPDGYEKSITMTQVQQQLVNTRENEKLAASIRADTEVIKATFDQKIEVTRAGAQANYTESTRTAEAEASKRKISAEAQAVSFVREKLGLSAADVVRYQQLQAYDTLSDATFLADLSGSRPMVNLAPSSATPVALAASQAATAAATAPEAASLLQETSLRQVRRHQLAGDDLEVSDVAPSPAIPTSRFLARALGLLGQPESGASS